MHILHLKDTLEVGGVSAVLHTLISTAQVTHATATHTVATFAPGPFADKLHNLNVPVHHLEKKSYRHVATLVKKINPTVIHAVGFTMLRYARLLHRLTGIPVVCGIHGDLNKIGRLQKHVQGLLMKVMGSWCSGYICVSEEVRRIVLSKLPRSYSPEKVHVIENGIPFSTVQNADAITRAAVGLPKNIPVIGSVGRLAREKSYDLLLHSVAPLCAEQKAVVCLVGDGPERGRLFRLAHDLSIANEVFFMGQQTPAAHWYSLFDCFVLSSQTEGLSISLLEAMAAGIPVVSTHQEGITHPVITHHTDGLLVPLNDAETMQKTIEHLLSDDALQTRLKKEALNRVQKFSAHPMTQKYMAVFKSVDPRQARVTD